MPATAGRVRMPANNRVHSSAALQTHGIWQSAIGYDPYAPNKDDKKKVEKEPEADNAYASFQGLLALARITGSNADEARGSCKKCGRVGHLTFQCRNFVSVKDDKDKDPEAIHAAVMSGLEKLKGNVAKRNKTAAESSEEESESSDSDYDSEIERVIAEKHGKKLGRKVKSSRKKRDDSDEDDSDSGGRKKRGRPKKRRTGKYSRSDSDDKEVNHRKGRRDKRRRRDESTDSDEDDDPRRRRKNQKEKRRRRSHRHSDGLDESEDSPRRHKRKSGRATASSDTDVNASEDSRIGGDKKHLGKTSRKRHHEDDE